MLLHSVPACELPTGIWLATVRTICRARWANGSRLSLCSFDSSLNKAMTSDSDVLSPKSVHKGDGCDVPKGTHLQPNCKVVVNHPVFFGGRVAYKSK